jgi:hypothetical protein
MTGAEWATAVPAARPEPVFGCSVSENARRVPLEGPGSDVSDGRRWRMSNGAANSRACADRCRTRVRAPGPRPAERRRSGLTSTPPNHDTSSPRWRGGTAAGQLVLGRAPAHGLIHT